jgi:hypothetical protein
LLAPWAVANTNPVDTLRSVTGVAVSAAAASAALTPGTIW